MGLGYLAGHCGEVDGLGAEALTVTVMLLLLAPPCSEGVN